MSLEDVEFIRASAFDGSFCCLVRKDQHGFIDRSRTWEVWLGYVWDGGNGKSTKYESPEAIVADGWTVD